MRHGWASALLAAGMTLVLPATAMAWDYPGHRIVGAIADIVLARDYPQTRDKVAALLTVKGPDGKDIVRTLREVAVFADCAKNEPQFCKRDPTREEIDYVLRNLVHKSFHFTNSPLAQKTYLAGGVGTGETDVVQMIGYAIAKLQDKNPYKRDVDLTKTEALWLLAHIIGDIHQPLHVGQLYYDTTCEKTINPNASRAIEAVPTFGGNAIKLTNRTIPSLHLFWDVTSVEVTMKEDGLAGDEQGFAAKLAATPPTDWKPSGGPATWAEAWYAEVMPLTNEAYDKVTVVNDKTQTRRPDFPSATVTCGWTAALDDTYDSWAAGKARVQLQKAGYRLAELLHAIFEP